MKGMSTGFVRSHVFGAIAMTDRTRFSRSRFCASIWISWMVQFYRLSRAFSRGISYMVIGRGS